MSTFRDHFSRQAEQYSRHRPSYPSELFDYLATLTPEHTCAWDCGTGNGQAARELARHFTKVIATDASTEQIRKAFALERVEYRAEPAEATTIPSGTIDLITVGTAVHWFEFDAFYSEVRRVSTSRAVLAVWAYHLPRISSAIDAWLERYFRSTLKGFWPERVSYLDRRYKTLPFPFEEITPPAFSMTIPWNLECFIGFLASWSGTVNFCDAKGEEAFLQETDAVRKAWGDPASTRQVTWDLNFRIGRVFPNPGAP